MFVVCLRRQLRSVLRMGRWRGSIRTLWREELCLKQPQRREKTTPLVLFFTVTVSIQKLAVLPMLTISWACLHYCWAPKKEEDHITTSSCPLGFYNEALRAHQCALFLTLIAVILALALSDFQLFMLCIVCILTGRVMVWDTMKTHWNKWITIYLFHKNIRYDCILFLVVWSGQIVQSKVISKLIISDFSYLRYHSIDSKNKE